MLSQSTKESLLKEEMKKLIRYHIKCKFCGSLFDAKEALRRHISSKHTDKLSCEKCEFKCNNKSSLYRHLKIHLRPPGSYRRVYMFLLPNRIYQ